MDLKLVVFIFCSYFLLLHPVSSKTAWEGSEGFRLLTKTDGSYSISINNKTWFNSAPTYFFSDGHKFVSGKDLELSSTTSNSGTDKIGQWTRINFNYLAGNSSITAYIKTYNDDEIPLVIFGQNYTNGAVNTSAGNADYTISSFPGFHLDHTTPSGLGWLSYGSHQFGSIALKLGNWTATEANINYGVDGGPLVVFDNAGNTVIISSANNFMSTSVYHEPLNDGTVAVHWGTIGLVETVPAQHVVETIVYYSSNGINKAFEGWGDYLRYRYNKDDQYVKSDLVVNYLGYWTDDGAYYWFYPEKHTNFQDTLFDIKSYIDKLQLPVKYIQYDSWWYQWGIGEGVKEWVAKSNVFPNGSQYVYNKTQWPVISQNKFWSSDTVYAKQNGGNYNFIVEKLKAVPVEQRFWDDLLKEARQWGLIVYEQDWLQAEFAGLNSMLTEIDLGRTWLNQMGKGAMKNGLTIQYCMALSRHAMQSLEVPVVTQARVSHDYKPGIDQWKIGISSMFAHAVGIRPFKDNFWSTRDQPNNRYNGTEPNYRLNAVVSTLSTGPVGPSDKIGYCNVTLIMRCCNTDGLILKPSKPATAIDDQIIQSALGSGGPDGEVWTTYSKIGELYFGIILAANMTNSYSLTPSKAGFNTFDDLNIFTMGNPYTLNEFSEQSPLRLTASCTDVNFCLNYASPVLQLGGHKIIIQGEISKWVPVSPQRVTQINQDSNELTIHITGQPGESVVFYFNVDGQSNIISCILGSSGSSRIYVLSPKCISS